VGSSGNHVERQRPKHCSVSLPPETVASHPVHAVLLRAPKPLRVRYVAFNRGLRCSGTGWTPVLPVLPEMDAQIDKTFASL